MKTSKRISLLILLIAAAGFAQMHQPMMPSNPQMEGLMIYHMTDYLELTPEQAEQFFPRMRNHQENMKNLFENIRTLSDKTKQCCRERQISEEELEKIISEYRILENSIREEKERYLEDLKPVLSPSQRAKLIFFEDEFRKELRMKLKQQPNTKGRKK
jgi:Spy/CpxP family protein refolding chaperone